MTDVREVIRAYWSAAQARDWEAFGALCAEDVLYEAPQSRERVRGRDAYIRFNRDGFTADWRITVDRVVGGGGEAASWIVFSQDGEDVIGLCFFELDEAGLIARIKDFWPEPYEPPANRAELTERF